MIEKFKKMRSTNYLTVSYGVSYIFLFVIGFPIWRKGIYWLADFINHTQTIGLWSEDIFYNFEPIVTGLKEVFLMFLIIFMVCDVIRYVSFRGYFTPFVYTLAKKVFLFVSRLGILSYLLSEFFTSSSFYPFTVYAFGFIWLVTRYILKPKLPIKRMEEVKLLKIFN